MSLNTSRLTITMNGTESSGSRTYSPAVGDTLSFSDGTGANKAQKVALATVALVSGAADTVALTSSSDFLDSNGDAITFSKIKAIAFETPSGNSAAIVIGAAGTNDWDTLLNAAGTLTLPPGTVVAFMTADANGWSVTASDVINVDGDGTDSVEIWVMGEGTAA